MKKLRIRPGDRKWFILIMAVWGIGSQVFQIWFGLTAFFVVLALAIPLGYFTGRVLKSRWKKYMIEEWRNDHPNMPDFWLPKHLKEKS